MRARSSKKNKINVVTLGCSKNLYDSEILISQLKANNKNVVHEEDGNIIVIKESSFLFRAQTIPHINFFGKYDQIFPYKYGLKLLITIFFVIIKKKLL